MEKIKNVIITFFYLSFQPDTLSIYPVFDKQLSDMLLKLTNAVDNN